MADIIHKDLRIPTMKKPIDTTPENIQKSFNELINHLNDRLTTIEFVTRTLSGAQGDVTPQNSINMQNKRIQGVARTQRGTDAINRDEVQALIKQSQRPISTISDKPAVTFDPSSATLGKVADALRILIDTFIAQEQSDSKLNP